MSWPSSREVPLLTSSNCWSIDSRKSTILIWGDWEKNSLHGGMDFHFFISLEKPYNIWPRAESKTFVWLRLARSRHVGSSNRSPVWNFFGLRSESCKETWGEIKALVLEALHETHKPEGKTAHCPEGQQADGERKDVQQTGGGLGSVTLPEALEDCGFSQLEMFYPHTIAQHLLQAAQPRFCFLGLKIVRMASSNTVFSPFWVNAEHSR